MLTVYDRRQSYEWNYERVPDLSDDRRQEFVVPEIPGNFTLAGRTLTTPLGIAAGPLLNGAWCRYYAALGFDFVTYKTVRSEARACHPLPNLQPIDRIAQLKDAGQTLTAIEKDSPSWAVSFGMPSRAPEVWQADVRRTREALPSRQSLSVSVVGSRDATWSELAADYGRCARLARESGADFVEANFSCPNVTTCDGQLYQSPAEAAEVAAAIRQAMPEGPLLIKIGFLPSEDDAIQLVDRLEPFADVIVTTNGMTAQVAGPDGTLMFDGHQRGICGDVIRESSVRQVERFRRAIERAGSHLEIVGVGGISTYRHVRQYLDAGAAAVQLATAVMRDPWVGMKILRDWQ